jgi:hypothetical protein
MAYQQLVEVLVGRFAVPEAFGGDQFFRDQLGGRRGRGGTGIVAVAELDAGGAARKQRAKGGGKHEVDERGKRRPGRGNAYQNL